ncbi:MAG: class I SAM-dependent methyltransferase [Acidobacteriota bacterium]|nr:class I SAM-dependent methyltransferase [Acidobacteriota bacterium]
MSRVGARLHETFGEIDIYVFDQLLKGRFDSARRVLDAGCGEGRNLHYLLSQGRECFGIDRTPAAIDEIRALAARLAPGLPAGNFVTGELDALPWPDRHFDVVICSAVLHFARDEAHFDRMLAELWRVLARGGVFFARLASVYLTAGAPEPRSGSSHQQAGRRSRNPDGSERFVVDEAMLMDRTSRLDGALLDPIKTTVVQQQRAMTTWVVRKP